MKKNRLNNILLGSLIGISTSIIIIWVIEENKSLLQVLLGFIIFLFPTMFISSFKSKIGPFIFIISLVLISYITYKLTYIDFWIGVVLSLLTGGSINYFRVSKFKIFSKSDYDKLMNK